MISKASYRPDVDGLRALAVIAVIVYHFLPEALPGGFVGVDVFFVISGYLITRQLSEKNLSLKTYCAFVGRRLTRLVPALVATVAITLITSALVMSPIALANLAREAIAASVFASNFWFNATSGYFDAAASTKPLLHTWSLGVEMQFYVAWPVLLALGTYLFRSRVLIFLLAQLLAGAVFSLVATNSQPTFAFYMMPTRLYEFAVGAIVAVLPVASKGRFSDIGYAVGVVFLFSAIATFRADMAFPGLIALLPTVGAGLCISFGKSTRLAEVAASRPASWVGRLSYALYLTHWPILVLTTYSQQRQTDVSDLPLLVGATVLAALLLHYGIERPSFGANAKPPAFRRLSPWILTAFVLSAIGASANAAATGWPWRIETERLAAIGDLDLKDFHKHWYGGTGCDIIRCETRPESELPKVFVVGDSHARALFQGLQAEIPEINFVVFGPDSCAFYTREFSHRNAFEENCLRSRALAWDEISSSGRPVIIAQHWSGRSTSQHVSSNATFDPFKTKEEFASFVATQLADLSQSLGNPRMAVIGGVPRFDGLTSPLDCSTQVFISPKCAFSSQASNYIEEQATINNYLRIALKPSIELWDPYDVLCDRSAMCANLDEDNHPIYSDQTHLSEWGSKLLVLALRDGILAFAN